MCAQVIRLDSGPLHSVLEVGKPLPVESREAPNQNQTGCQLCVPARIGNFLSEAFEVPPECLPVPEGATVPCPELQVFCTTGLPVPAGPGLINVPEQVTILAHQIRILAPSGAVVCAVDIPTHSFRPIPHEVSCPTSEGVTCTCSTGPVTCEGCGFQVVEGTLILECRFTFVTTIQCQACPLLQVRGLGRISTGL